MEEDMVVVVPTLLICFGHCCIVIVIISHSAIDATSGTDFGTNTTASNAPSSISATHVHVQLRDRRDRRVPPGLVDA